MPKGRTTSTSGRVSRKVAKAPLPEKLSTRQASRKVAKAQPESDLDVLADKVCVKVLDRLANHFAPAPTPTNTLTTPAPVQAELSNIELPAPASMAASSLLGELPSSPNEVALLSAPLGVHVAPEVRQKILQGKFVELHLLLPNKPMDNPKSDVKQARPNLSIGEFMTGFHTLAAIRTEKFPLEAPGLLKHAETVHQLHLAFGAEACRHYDRNFRMAKEFSPLMPWGQTHLELYMMATSQGLSKNNPTGKFTKSARGQAPNRSPNHYKELRPNTCYTFQLKGFCDKKNCNYTATHSCYTCHGPHATSACKLASIAGSTSAAGAATNSPATTNSQQSQPFRGARGSKSTRQ